MFSLLSACSPGSIAATTVPATVQANPTPIPASPTSAFFQTVEPSVTLGPTTTHTPSATPPVPTASATPLLLKNLSRSAFPVSGPAVAALTSYDDAMWNFMQANNIQAGTIAVMKSGKLVFSRGYGWLDAGRTEPLPPDALFRAPGPNKALTAVAIKQLIQKQKISPTTHLIPFLALTPIPGPTPDPVMDAITVQQALDSIVVSPGGQTTVGADLIIEHQADIITALGLAGPPTAQDIARYVDSHSMNFIKQGENGSLKLSYLFLGLAVEKASSQAYLDYVEKVILTPLGITDVKLAHSLPSLRDPKEANYLSPATCANVVSAEPASVPCADGGFNIEALYGDDGLIMSAPSMAKIMLNYTYLGDFNPHRATTQAAYFGGLPGVATIEVWLKGDVQIAVMLNSNSGNVDQFHTALIDATNSIKNWP